MKIIHTSDWHLGQTLYDYDRFEEHSAMLAQLTDLVAGHRPDALVLSGDVFHTSQPSATVQRMFADALLAIRRASPDTEIITIAGNHDSPSRHDIFTSPWRALGVHTFGFIDRECPASQIVELPGKGFIAVVPYVHERSLPEGYFRQVLEAVEQPNTDNLPVVLMAHTTVTGCDFTGHTSADERSVGGIDAISLDELGEGYDYVALGHIHRPQTLAGSRARYCGTPVPVTFDETCPHSVSLVEIGAHGQLPAITLLDIANPWPLVTLPSHGYASPEECLALLEEFPADRQAYIRLNIEVKPGCHLTGITQQARRICNGKQARFCLVNPLRSGATTERHAAMSVAELHDIDPLDMARRYANDIKTPLTDEQAEMLRQVIDAVHLDESAR